jgi:aspartyl-tRNA(Asn)/glutamyl-tRNA(Gln) amidotransferase subunit B
MGAVREGSSMLDTLDDIDVFVLTQILEDAANSMALVRVYPGMRADRFIPLIDAGVRTIFLELWDSGTACFREGPYSLRPLLAYGRKHGVRFYCTSQQEVPVVFSEFANSRELWREGVIPMGVLTTETAMARYLAASIVADEDDERLTLMEEGVALWE